MAAPVRYKTSAQDASQMATAWYALAGVANPSPKAISWWTKQIQQNGSQPAFDDFKTAKGQDSADTFNPQTLAQNAAKLQQTSGLNPWQPSKDTPQLPGTNTKSGGAIIGSALNSPVGQVIEDLAAAVADVVTGGAATPFTTAGLAAARGGGTALQPGANIGDIAGATLKGAGTGAAIGTGAGLLNSATGGALEAGTASLPNAATMNPADLAKVADASATPSTASLGLPGVSSVAGGLNAAKAAVGGVAGNTGGLPQPSAVSNSGNGLTDLLNSLGTTVPGIAGAANAANLQGQSQQYATDALKTQTGLFDQTAPLRTAGIAGMLNPSTPAPGMPEIAALRSIAATGNPFAPKPTASPSMGAPLVAPTSPGLPTPAPINPAGPQIQQAGKPIPPQDGLPTPAPVDAGGGGGSQNLVY